MVRPGLPLITLEMMLGGFGIVIGISHIFTALPTTEQLNQSAYTEVILITLCNAIEKMCLA